jgi:glycosyltransferase involved in cell wall biosynthesis
VAGSIKLRIVQIISSSATSGAERHVFALSKLLCERGHYVEVVCPSGGWLPQELRQNGLTVKESDMRGSGWFRTAGYLTNRVKYGEFDIVHSHLTRATYFGSLAGIMRKVPAIATVHIANHDQVYKRMARGRNRLIAVSNFVRGMLHGREIPDKFIDTVYNGTDFTQIQTVNPDRVKAELGIPEDRRLVGLVGRVCREKGHLLMISAMKDVLAEHRNAHLVFVGRVEEQFETELQEAVREAGIEKHVTMTGNRHDIPRMLDSFEFTVMPSHQETFGVAAIEAMARKKPVVASRIGGLPEVVRHGQTGLLVDLRPDEVSEAANYLFANEVERTQMGVLGRIVVEEKFTLNHMVDRVERIYSRAVGRE